MLSIALLLIACENSGENPNNPNPSDNKFECEETSRDEISDNDILASAQSDTLFALDLKEEVQELDSNLFISPFSISSALGLLHLGANGISDTEMQEVLHMQGEESWHSGKGLLTQELHQPERCDYELAIANRIFAQTGYPIIEDYLGESESIYGAPVQDVDFLNDPVAGREIINTWVSEQTKENIPELLPEGIITPNTKLVLTNAIYMNAPWKTSFDPDKTQSLPFTTESGEIIETDTMIAEEMEVRSYQDELMTMATFDYEGEELSMSVYVPRDGVTLQDLENELDAEALIELRDLQTRDEKHVFFPKFELRSKLILNDPLIKLGMGSIFDPENADLSGINELGQLYVSTVVHEAWLRVDEAGTEAAAATAVVVADAAVEVDTYNIKVDRAFMFTIQDELSGSILFMGRVADPSKL